MAVQTASGCKFYIGPQNTTADDTTAYGALSYTEVGEIEDISDFGDVFNEVNFTALADSRVRKFKGSVNAGTITVNLGLDVDDAGQAACETARDQTSAALWEYAFKVELNDSGGTNPTTYYFRGQVMSYTVNIGSVEQIIGSTVVVSINSKPRELAAA